MNAHAPKRILVVDDEEDAREALTELLELCSYSVVCAENGLAALEQIRSWRVPPALILLDLCMPVMGGYSFLCRAREDPLIKNVPIIVTTADSGAQAPGAYAILHKPLKPAILIATVRRSLKPPENSSSLSLQGLAGPIDTQLSQR